MVANGLAWFYRYRNNAGPYAVYAVQQRQAQNGGAWIVLTGLCAGACLFRQLPHSMEATWINPHRAPSPMCKHYRQIIPGELARGLRSNSFPRFE